MEPTLKPAIKPLRATPKAGETRNRILTAAVNLFRERGFDETSMREIAVAANVAIGAAYYYFDSKEALVMAFYHQAKDAMQEPIEAALSRKTDLKSRLRAVIDVKFEYFRPNRKFLGALLRHAADPGHPLSPFSQETRGIRELDMQHFSVALEGSNLRMPDDLRPYLPKLLWLYQMGLILFWVYDQSPGEARTEKLVEKSLGIVTSLLKLAKSPFLRPVRKTAIELLQAVSDEEAPA
ncbi:MAG TPA: TetR family transcriptional regulator [Bryobacteraceae bacterium]|jgi:AcrR family transcriptional regulator|nr:TetR family transcriptional regulator [Bryobacteraceae bacterium]